MSELENLSEEQLVKMISAKKMGSGSSESSNSPDYSQQTKRGLSDSLRDLGYGLTKGVVGGLNALRSPLDDKFIQALGKKAPDVNEVIDKIKSPYPSPGGNALQKAGEYGPMLLSALNLARSAPAIEVAIGRIPSITRRGMERPYAQAARTAVEENVGGLQHPPELMQQTREFLESQNVPMGNRLERMLSGEYGGARETRSTLGQLSRSLPFNSGERVGAGNLHADVGRSTLSELERLGFPRTHAATRHADEHYARSQRLRSLLTDAFRHVSGLSTLRTILRHL